MRKYLIRYKIFNSIILDDCVLYAKNKTIAKIKFLKACKPLTKKPFIYFIQELKNASNN